MTTVIAFIPSVIMLIALTVATVTDIKTKQIPLWLMPSSSILSLIIIIHTKQAQLKQSIIIGIIFFIIFLAFALASKGGGGDAIMLGCIGLTTRDINGAFAFMWLFCLFVFLFFAFFTIYNKKAKKKVNLSEFPMAAVALPSYLIFILISLLS